MKDTKFWLIWSHEHKAWWQENRNGYTTEKSKAGRYDFLDAYQICRESNIVMRDTPEETMVPVGAIGDWE